MRKTKQLKSSEYHTHYILRSYRDMIAEHVQLEQQMGGFTENATMTKPERNKYYQELGANYQLSKK